MKTIGFSYTVGVQYLLLQSIILSNETRQSTQEYSTEGNDGLDNLISLLGL